MKLNKLLICLLLVLLFVVSLVGCDKGTNETIEVSVYVPDGAPALAIANLYGNDTIDGITFSTNIVTPTDITAKVATGEADMAIVPLNLAVSLYDKGANYSLVTVNTMGLLYLLSTDEITSLSDLSGQVVGSIGKGNVPQFVFDKVADAEELTIASENPTDSEVAVQYYSSGADLIPLLATDKISNALLGEPAVTKAKVLAKKNGIDLFELDMQQQWQHATDSEQAGYPQAGLIVNNDFAKNNAKQLKQIVELLGKNNDFLTKNVENVSQLLADNGSKDLNGTTFTTELLARCNIDCVMASDMKQEIEQFLLAMNLTMPQGDFIIELN